VTVEHEIEEIHENIIYNDRVVEIDAAHIGNYRDGTILPTKVNTIHETVNVDRPYYVDNIIEQVVENVYDVEREVVVENRVQREIIDHVDVPVYQDNIITQVVQREVPYTTERRVEVVVDRPRHVENVIRREIPVERVVEQIVEVDRPEYVERRNEYEVIEQVDRPYEVERIVEQVIRQPVHRTNVIRRPREVEVVRENRYEVVRENRYEVEKIVDVPVEVVRTEIVEQPVERRVEVPVEQIIEHTVENIVEKPIYRENIIHEERVYEQTVRREVENVIERPVYQDNIIQTEKIIYNDVHRPYDVITEKIVEVEVPRYVEVMVDVPVERPVHVDRVVQVETIIENVIEKPVEKVVEVHVEVDEELNMNVARFRAEWDDLTLKRDNLMATLRTLESEAAGLGRVVDWETEWENMRRRIFEIEMQISQSRKTTTQSKQTERRTTVHMVANPEATALKNRLNDLQSQQSVIRQKINFQDERTRYGASNYEYSTENVGGSMVRKLRKSNKNSQNLA
jgi:hypothetical protein